MKPKSTPPSAKSKRGGKRPGAGRKKSAQPTIVVSFRVKEDDALLFIAEATDLLKKIEHGRK